MAAVRLEEFSGQAREQERGAGQEQAQAVGPPPLRRALRPGRRQAAKQRHAHHSPGKKPADGAVTFQARQYCAPEAEKDQCRPKNDVSRIHAPVVSTHLQTEIAPRIT